MGDVFASILQVLQVILNTIINAIQYVLYLISCVPALFTNLWNYLNAIPTLLFGFLPSAFSGYISTLFSISITIALVMFVKWVISVIRG